MSRLAPDTLQALMDLRDRAAAAPHGERTALVHRFAQSIGRSPATVYRWLKDHAGYSVTRKKRSDAGQTRLPKEVLEFVAAAKKEGVRGNGKATVPTAVAMNLAHANGIVVPVSEGRVNALLRRARMDVAAQSAARSHVTLRSLHPNHVHQIDPSLCLLYYTPRGQAIMRDEEFYKNKPASMEKVRMKVWRYVRYDHASATVDVRYFEAAGENQLSLFEFLMYTWGRQDGRLSYGVPKLLLWDKGSANTSRAICRLLDALGVEHQTHATGHAWAKGGVEQANNLVETHFESRLRFEPVQSVAQLNEAAARWARDFNANAIPHVDSRIVRASGVPMVRDDLWQLILRTPEALVELPAREVCRWFLTGREITRVVRDLAVSFAHPELKRSARYDLSAWADFVGNGQAVTLSPLLAAEGAVRVEIPRVGDAPLIVTAQPERDFDEFGRVLAAPVIGEEYARAPISATESAANRLAAAAWGEGVNAEGAEKKRAGQARPFAHFNDGKGLVAHSQLGEAQLPQRILPAPTEVRTAQVQQAQAAFASVALSIPEAVRAIRSRLGAATPADLYTQLKRQFPDGNVPQTWADDYMPVRPGTGTHGKLIELHQRKATT